MVTEMTKHQPYGYIRNLGKVRILCYVGNDRFRVLRLSTDSTYRVHRDRIVFLPS